MSVKQMALVWELDLPREQKYVLLALADHADHDGNNVRPSLELVSYKTGYSEDQLRRIYREILKAELMVKTREAKGRGNPPEYKLQLEKGCILPAFLERKRVASERKRVASEDEKGCTAMPPEPSIKEPSIEEPYSPNGEITPAHFVALLDEGLRDLTPTLTQARKARYGREFKEMLRRETPPEVLDEAVDRIIERWPAYQLTVEQAIRDKQNGNGHRRNGHVSKLPEDEYVDPCDGKVKKKKDYSWMFN